MHMWCRTIIEPPQTVQASRKPKGPPRPRPKPKKEVQDARWSETDRIVAKNFAISDLEVEDDEPEALEQILSGDPFLAIAAYLVGLIMVVAGIFMMRSWGEVDDDLMSVLILGVIIFGVVFVLGGVIGYIIGWVRPEMRQRRGLPMMISIGVAMPIFALLAVGVTTQRAVCVRLGRITRVRIGRLRCHQQIQQVEVLNLASRKTSSIAECSTTPKSLSWQWTSQMPRDSGG